MIWTRHLDSYQQHLALLLKVHKDADTLLCRSVLESYVQGSFRKESLLHETISQHLNLASSAADRHFLRSLMQHLALKKESLSEETLLADEVFSREFFTSNPVKKLCASCYPQTAIQKLLLLQIKAAFEEKTNKLKEKAKVLLREAPKNLLR